MRESHEFHSQMHEIDALLQEANQSANPASQARLQAVAAGLLRLHRTALEKILQQINNAGECGAKIISGISRDESISGILVLHGLHPQATETRVRAALEKVAPYTKSHGGHIEFLSLSPEGVVNLRMEGSCHGCPSSRVTLQSSIEQE